MPEELTPAQKAARTRKLRAIEREAQQKHADTFAKARESEAASKKALTEYCEKRKWRVAFFEGATGSPRTGIIDAIMFRIAKGNADVLDLRLVQLKGGKAGISGAEIARLKKAIGTITLDWIVAAFDGSVFAFAARGKGSRSHTCFRRDSLAGSRKTQRSGKTRLDYYPRQSRESRGQVVR